MEWIVWCSGHGGVSGMQDANPALLQLVEEGRVNASDALAQSLKPNELAQAFRGKT